jgi:hypothetical protein
MLLQPIALAVYPLTAAAPVPAAAVPASSPAALLT